MTGHALDNPSNCATAGSVPRPQSPLAPFPPCINNCSCHQWNKHIMSISFLRVPDILLDNPIWAPEAAKAVSNGLREKIFSGQEVDGSVFLPRMNPLWMEVFECPEENFRREHSSLASSKRNRTLSHIMGHNPGTHLECVRSLQGLHWGSWRPYSSL